MADGVMPLVPGGRNVWSRACLGMTLGLIAGLAGCATSQETSPPTTAMAALPGAAAVNLAEADLIGDWGLASFRTEADRERTEAEARRACSNPYKVAAGASGGVMMYLADQSQPTEVVVKRTSGGQVFIGPPGPPGVAQDRVVLSFENNILISDWLDPSARERYGTMIFIRCGVA